jgi:hypothetical protein
MVQRLLLINHPQDLPCVQVWPGYHVLLTWALLLPLFLTGSLGQVGVGHHAWLYVVVCISRKPQQSCMTHKMG